MSEITVKTAHPGQDERDVCFIHSTLDDAGLSAAAFRVYCHLNRRGAEGSWPSVPSIAAICRLHPDTVWRALGELRGRGVMKSETRPGTSNLYVLAPLSTWQKVGGTGKGGVPLKSGCHPTESKGRGAPESEGRHPPEKEGHEGTPLKVIHKGNPKKGIHTPQPPKGGERVAVAVAEVITVWNALGLSQVTLTDKRAKIIPTRLKTDWKDKDWRAAIQKIPQSNFLMGGGDKEWVADIDWLLQPDSVTKILEGKYHKRLNGSNGARPIPDELPWEKKANGHTHATANHQPARTAYTNTI